MSERDARLTQFFAGYFNQDWDINGAKSWMDVVAQYVKENSRATVLSVRDDLRSWLGETTSGQGIPAAFGCDYDPRPDGTDEREWVRLLADFMEKQLTN
jgi:hypothetical protein